MAAPDLRRFSRLVFFTGAGLSAESGIATYRGEGGVWTRYRYEDYACQRAFRRAPERVWEFHDARRADVAAAAPNAAHRLIAAIQAARPGTAIVTQNIDGLHQAAGATDVIELHGSLWRLRCEACGARCECREVPLADKHCACGAWWRPDLVWFEDPLDGALFSQAAARLSACDCLVAIGTSALVHPAAELPMLAFRSAALTIEINPEETPLSRFYDHCLRGPASAMLAALWAEAGEVTREGGEAGA
ncbi:NAD-dependent protein deacylase [bacterium]|nr:NAD-dependent protein deacylase [bacterium]